VKLLEVLRWNADEGGNIVSVVLSDTAEKPLHPLQIPGVRFAKEGGGSVRSRFRGDAQSGDMQMVTSRNLNLSQNQRVRLLFLMPVFRA